VRHSNGGGGNATTPFEEPDDKQSEVGLARQRANSAAKEDLSTLKAVWSCSPPQLLHFAAKWGAEGMEVTMCQCSKDSHEQWLGIHFLAGFDEHFRRVIITFNAYAFLDCCEHFIRVESLLFHRSLHTCMISL
jgi:hypothetical protein